MIENGRKGVEELPEPIKEEIIRTAMEGFEDERNRPYNQLYITELAWCLRRAFFRRKYGETMTLEKAWNFYKGIVFDRLWTPLFKQNQKRCTYQVPGTDIVISGRCDFIYPDYEEMFELKTISSLYYVRKEKKAKDEHNMQTVFYAYCNGYKKASIIYTDLGSVMKFGVDMDNADEIMKDIIDNALKLNRALMTNISPDSRGQDFECATCEHRERCKRKDEKNNKEEVDIDL